MHVICSCTKAETVVEFKAKNHKSYIIWTFLICQSMDYERPVRKLPSLHPQIFRYGRSIFCLPHRPKFSNFFDLFLHWVSVVRVMNDIITLLRNQNQGVPTSFLRNNLHGYNATFLQGRFCCFEKIHILVGPSWISKVNSAKNSSYFHSV